MITFDAHYFAACVRTKRGDRSLRDAAQDIGQVSPATLLRIEEEDVIPDIGTFLRLCDWMAVPTNLFIHSGEPMEIDTVALIEQELRADNVLSGQVISAFLTLLRAVRGVSLS